MNVLSLFDGISCLQLALQRSGIHYTTYYASEINKDAIKVTQYHFPATIQLGDVRKINFDDLPTIDLIAAGSPCQDISSLNSERLGLIGAKSSLFYYFLQAKEHWPNAYFLLENVKNARVEKEISRLLGLVRPIRLNSSWIVPHSRPRLYWTNIPVWDLPKKKYNNLTSFLQKDVDEKYYQTTSWNKWWENNKEKQLSKQYCSLDAQIAGCLTHRMYKSWAGNFITQAGKIRRLTPVECERLQTLPDGYTSMISDTAAYAAIGNGWTVDIIAHLLKNIKHEND